MARKPRPVRGLSASVSEWVRVMSGLYRSISEPQPPASGAKALLQDSDFTYLGYYTISGNLNGTDPEWGGCLTHRYVGGQLRFIIYAGSFLEFALPPGGYGSTISTVTNAWPKFWSTANSSEAWGHQLGLWWDEPGQRMWTTLAADYPQGATAYDQGVTFRGIHTRTLNSDGTIGNLRGGWKLEGVGQRKMYGGFQAVPSWFQAAYGAGPYCTGWGGYVSLFQQYVTAVVGGSFYTLPDPTAYADNVDIPAAMVKTGMTHTDEARGRRLTTDYRDYYDTLVSASPPPPTDPLGPYDPTNQGGLGYFSYGDSYWNTGCWIDGTTKHGFVAIASLNGGQAYYWGSTLNRTATRFELHIFDPTHLGEAILGARTPTSVQPAAWAEWTLPGLGAGTGGNGPHHSVGGATFDSVTGRLYVHGVWIEPSIENRLYVFQVNT